MMGTDETRPTLAELMLALQDLGQAVTDDDLGAYRVAVARARRAGASWEQITDGYSHRAMLRLHHGLAPVGFRLSDFIED